MVAQWTLINQNYNKMEGYKRVAWPPASQERIVREYTPQPQSQPTPPGSHYNPQEQQQQPPTYNQQQPNVGAVAPAQGPIYNNVHSAVRQSSPYPNQYQQRPQQQQYAPAQNYEQQQHQLQQQQQHQQHPQQQQSAQYTQSQYNSQTSRDSLQSGSALSQQQQQQQPQPQSHYQPQQNQLVTEPTSPSGWKPIHPPVSKPHSQYHSTVGGESNYPIHSASSNYQQQQPQQQYQQQQFRATSYDQQQPQQQQQQHYQPQPPYQQPQQYPNQSNQCPYQPSQQQVSPLPQQQQQQPNWRQTQQPIPYQQQQPQSNYISQPQQQSFDSYSQQYQPQQPGSQDLPDYYQQQPQALPQDYRGGSPGIITLRKEAPVSQKPAPVYTSQPAAVNYQGGSNLRGDLKWPPPEYKEAAARENEERRQLALGPVCRPRKVNRDYSPFFAKNALNSYYPSYKVPPGTQHMLS